MDKGSSCHAKRNNKCLLRVNGCQILEQEADGRRAWALINVYFVIMISAVGSVDVGGECN